ncbi:MAG TPA: hypothetical protein VJ742_13105 [Nitrososphaera sp.]|nr:hypothetical protein [Nitrososphaera sp.]
MDIQNPDHKMFYGWTPAQIKRFWDSIEIKDDGHWIWHGLIIRNSQGPIFSVITTDDRKLTLSLPGFMWKLYHGEPPENRRAKRNCGEKLCISPYHLELYKWTTPLNPKKPGRKKRPDKPEPPKQCGNGHDLIGPRRVRWDWKEESWRWTCITCSKKWARDYRERHPEKANPPRAQEPDWKERAREYLKTV